MEIVLHSGFLTINEVSELRIGYIVRAAVFAKLPQNTERLSQLPWRATK